MKELLEGLNLPPTTEKALLHLWETSLSVLREDPHSKHNLMEALYEISLVVMTRGIVV